MASSKNDYREIKERSLEVCRDFVRSRCSRSDLDCRFAHPPNYVEVREGRVIVCFDFTKVIIPGLLDFKGLSDGPEVKC